jgi:hypothetical protein
MEWPFRPYHGILLLEDIPLSIDASPTIMQLLRYCTPSKSLQDLCSDADLPLSQVFLVVRHLITWGKAVVIYPLCETNLYAVASDAALSKQLLEQFSETMPGHQLSTVLAEFSPPATLDDFTNPMLHELSEQVGRAVLCICIGVQWRHENCIVRIYRTINRKSIEHPSIEFRAPSKSRIKCIEYHYFV